MRVRVIWSFGISSSFIYCIGRLVAALLRTAGANADFYKLEWELLLSLPLNPSFFGVDSSEIAQTHTKERKQTVLRSVVLTF